jgi:hypothetical protein
MSHHDGIEDDRMQEIVKRFNLGPTGQFPQGKLTPHDEGEIRIAIGIENGKVVMHFGKEIAWIGFDPAQAHSLAQSLIEKANAIGS